jgi:hypothetical protein
MTYEQAQQILASREGDENTPEQQAALDFIIAAVDKSRKAKEYLANTDWYVIRQQEQGTLIPEDVLAKRQEARDSVV